MRTFGNDGDENIEFVSKEDLDEEEEKERDRLLAAGFADWGRRDFQSFIRSNEKHGRQVRTATKLAQKLGPTSVFYRCIPTGMHGPTCIFWANLC